MLLQHVIVEPSNMLDHDTYRVISFLFSITRLFGAWVMNALEGELVLDE